MKAVEWLEMSCCVAERCRWKLTTAADYFAFILIPTPKLELVVKPYHNGFLFFSNSLSKQNYHKAHHEVNVACNMSKSHESTKVGPILIPL
jgi:hypothetical protein